MIDQEALKSLEKLHEMKSGGIISEEEFEQAKQDLLSGRRKVAPVGRSAPKGPAELPADTNYLGWMLLPLKRYVQFEGRSSRKEFWLFFLALNLFTLALMILSLGLGLGMTAGLILLVMLGTFIPLLAVEVRRFHDQNRSGWFALLNLIPYAGPLVVLAFMLIPGAEGENEYGPDPLI